MKGDILTEHRVAALNVHRIISRAAGERESRADRREHERTVSDRAKAPGAARPPMAQ